MKKSMILSLIAVYVLSISSLVLAEDLTGKSTVGVDLSYFSCEGWENDEWDQAGLMVEAKYRYFINENIALGGSVGYWSSSDELDLSDPFLGTMTMKRTLTIIPILVNAEYFFSLDNDKLKPYVGLSLGLFNSTAEAEMEMFGVSASTDESASPIGFRLGGGVEYQVSPKVSLSGNLKYQILSIDFEDVSDEECDANGLIIGAGINLIF